MHIFDYGMECNGYNEYFLLGWVGYIDYWEMGEGRERGGDSLYDG